MDNEQVLDNTALGYSDTSDDLSSTTSLQDTAGHDDNLGDDSGSLQATEYDASKYVKKEDFDRLSKKMSAIEKKEADKAKASKDPKVLDKSTLERLDAEFAGNPGNYESWRREWVKNGGYDYGDYNKVYGSTQAQNVQQVQQKVDPSDVWTMVGFANEVKGFLNEHPEFDSEYLDDPEEATKRQMELKFLFETANARQEVSRSQGKNLPRSQALQQALVALDPEKYLSEATTNGRYAGMQDAFNRGAGRSSGLSSGGSKTGEVQLTDEDRLVAKKLGLSEKDMLEEKKLPTINRTTFGE